MNTINFNTFQDPEFKTQLEEQFINPLKELGFELVGTNSFGPTDLSDNISGCHTLIFERTRKLYPYDISEIQKLMVDDDSQPLSTYQLYFGTLWVFIPYSI